MEPQSTTDFLISHVRMLCMPEMTFFYVTNQATSFTNLDRDLDLLLESLYTAKALANLAQVGPDITRYYMANPGKSDLYLMEVGIPVKPGTLPAGEAQVKTLSPYHCASVLLWGSLAHIAQAHGALRQTIEERGLASTGECREWNYLFESVDSPNNLMGLYMEIL